jgi:hypothetical protein
LEFGGGTGGQGSADYPVAGRLPGHASSIEGEGLARAGPADYNLGTIAGARDHVPLLGR